LHPKKRSTLADVAAAAGVSKMTASRALRGASDVSKSSLEKVAQAAREMGYVGNHLATSLSTQRSKLIGVVVPSLTNIVFSEVLSGIVETIEGSGMQPVFGVTDYDPNKENNVIRNMLSWNPAGLIVTGLDQPSDTKLLLENAGIPVVQIMDTDGTPVDACVGLSHHAAGVAMADALIDAGLRRIGYIGCGLDRDTRAMKRFAGFEASLSRHGLGFEAKQIESGPSTIKAGRQFTKRVLAQYPNLDCIYYSNDDLAAGGAFHCIASGVRVPTDLTLAGFNGLDFIESMPIQIATSHTPRRAIGTAAAELVLNVGTKGGGQQVEFVPKISFGL
jgi:LacI family gluconate utilization system Gnt-I transcriptional repressor